MVSQAECTRLSVVRVVQPALTPSAQEAKKSSPTSIRDSYPILNFRSCHKALNAIPRLRGSLNVVYFLCLTELPIPLPSHFLLFPPGFLGKRFRLKSKEQNSKCTQHPAHPDAPPI